MPLLGQASGGFTESSSALRILHVGIRNTVGVLTADSFTQTNPPANAATFAAAGTTTAQVDNTLLGVLSGSIAFTRRDGGSNFIGGPDFAGALADQLGCAPLGCFINSANGNAFENTPGTASGKGPYVSAQGTYGNSLFEDSQLGAAVALTYNVGDLLFASANGYLTNDNDIRSVYQTAAAGAFGMTIMGVLKMPADATQDELVFDQRV